MWFFFFLIEEPQTVQKKQVSSFFCFFLKSKNTSVCAYLQASFFFFFLPWLVNSCISRLKPSGELCLVRACVTRAERTPIHQKTLPHTILYYNTLYTHFASDILHTDGWYLSSFVVLLTLSLQTLSRLSLWRPFCVPCGLERRFMTRSEAVSVCARVHSRPARDTLQASLVLSVRR